MARVDWGSVCWEECQRRLLGNTPHECNASLELSAERKLVYRIRYGELRDYRCLGVWLASAGAVKVLVAPLQILLRVLEAVQSSGYQKVPTVEFRYQFYYRSLLKSSGGRPGFEIPEGAAYFSPRFTLTKSALRY